jgi:hypothetical protein
VAACLQVSVRELNGMGAGSFDEDETLHEENKPLNEKMSWARLRDETSSQVTWQKLPNG